MYFKVFWLFYYSHIQYCSHNKYCDVALIDDVEIQVMQPKKGDELRF